MIGLLELAGIRQNDKAHALANLLAISHRPVTLMFRDTFGIDLHPVPVRTGTRGLSVSEASALDAPPGKPCRHRTSRLETADGQLAAGAFLLWLPGRLDGTTCGALDAGEEPAGAILSRLPGGAHRDDLRAVAAASLDEITGERAVVRSRAVLVTRAGRVAVAEENFMAAFVEGLR